MVKVWGYNYPSNGRSCPSSMFATQTLRNPSTSGAGSVVEKVKMKLPNVYTIQRLALARHLMYLSHPEVRKGKEASPKEFEANRIKFRKLGIDLRASVTKGGVKKAIRKRREVVEETPQEGEGGGQQRKWDIEGMSFKSIAHEAILERRKMYYKNKKRTAEEAEEEERRSQEEEWQRTNWKGKYIRDRRSDRVNEILANYRMVTYNGTAVGYQPGYTIFLESAIYALKTHNWPVICKCLCGMAEKIRSIGYMRDNSQVPSALTAFWMLGLLTVTNHYKDDVKKVEEFARNVHALLGGHPLWIASHLSVWLIQKGYFMAAYRIANEFSLERISAKSRFRTPSYNKLEHPQRDMAVYLTQMVKAVYLYCIWKKEATVLDAHEINSSENRDVDELTGELAVRRDALRRNGEAALGAFEICYDKYKAIEGDAMCFIHPFIELVIEFRSVHRAREILEEVFNINDGNMFVEEFYVEFLEEHYANTEEDHDLINFLKGRTSRKFNYAEGEEENREVVRVGKRQIRQLKEAKKKSSGEDASSMMKKICKPAFSW